LYWFVAHINPMQYFESFITGGKYDSLGGFTYAIDFVIPGSDRCPPGSRAAQFALPFLPACFGIEAGYDAAFSIGEDIKVAFII
jgi:hypothetical protein